MILPQKANPPQKTTPEEVALLPALPSLVVWSAGASHANPITPQESRQRQRHFFAGFSAGFGSGARGADLGAGGGVAGRSWCH